MIFPSVCQSSSRVCNLGGSNVTLPNPSLFSFPDRFSGRTFMAGGAVGSCAPFLVRPHRSGRVDDPVAVLFRQVLTQHVPQLAPGRLPSGVDLNMYWTQWNLGGVFMHAVRKVCFSESSNCSALVCCTDFCSGLSLARSLVVPGADYVTASPYRWA